MDGTRASIVELLLHGDALTVETLTESLGLAPATVRRHLDVLQRDGHVERDAVRRATGRPHYAFRLTQAGRELAPGHYSGVVGLVMAQLLSLTPEDTRGKDGAAVALLALERMNHALLRACESRVTAPAMSQRLEEAAEALAAGGMMLGSTPREDGFEVRVRDCACRCTASAQGTVCRNSEAMLERLLGTKLRRLPAAESCSFLVGV